MQREDLRDPKTGSHPLVRFDSLPAVEGPLNNFNSQRPSILKRVVARSVGEFGKKGIENLLEEAVFYERLRLRRSSKLNMTYLFTYPRRRGDLDLWSSVKSDLKKDVTPSNREEVLESILTHYADEVGAHFSPKVYNFATHAVPYGFNWLLNAISLKRFVPWNLSSTLESKLNILGEVSHLQKLSKKGTILLLPTHQSNIDSMLIGYVIHLMRLPAFSYGAGLNLFINPIFSFFMGNLGAYTVDRQKTNQLYKSILKNYSTEILKEGVHSIFFPGGKRCKSGAIENKLKLGLLGTAIQAQIENYQSQKENPSVFVVPMVMSYHFVLEASSLIEDYLSEEGKHRFYSNDSDDPWALIKTARFFTKFFSEKGAITARVGKPMDIFGNLVDEEGRSYGTNGIEIDPKKWLTSQGETRADFDRDREYTHRLGHKVSERFHLDNTVLTSHLVAYAFFMTLRKKYPQLNLYRFLRLSRAQRRLPLNDFYQEAGYWYDRVKAMSLNGKLYLSHALSTLSLQDWVQRGVSHLGVMHDHSVLKIEDNIIFTEDMNLLYYYRNRLTGYGLTLDSGEGSSGFPGEYDEKGFLV